MKRRCRPPLIIEGAHEVHNCFGQIPLDLSDAEAKAGRILAVMEAVASAEQSDGAPWFRHRRDRDPQARDLGRRRPAPRHFPAPSAPPHGHPGGSREDSRPPCWRGMAAERALTWGEPS